MRLRPVLANVLRAAGAMKENARQGFWNGALPPIGYRIVEAVEQGGHHVKKALEIDPIQAETVRLIFRLARGGVPPVGKRVAMLGFAPAADKLLEARKPLGHHHESNILVATANELQRVCSQFVSRCELSRLDGRTLLQPATLID
jgi:hypothetical protein